MKRESSAMIEAKERTVSVASSSLSESKVSSKDSAGDKSSKETQHAAAPRKRDLRSSRANLGSHCGKLEKDPEKGSSEYPCLEPIDELKECGEWQSELSHSPDTALAMSASVPRRRH